MSARKPRNRKEQEQRRIALINKYMSEVKRMLMDPECPIELDDWLLKGDPYHRSLKLIAEREVYKLEKAKEVRKLGT